MVDGLVGLIKDRNVDEEILDAVKLYVISEKTKNCSEIDNFIYFHTQAVSGLLHAYSKIKDMGLDMPRLKYLFDKYNGLMNVKQRFYCISIISVISQNERYIDKVISTHGSIADPFDSFLAAYTLSMMTPLDSEFCVRIIAYIYRESLFNAIPMINRLKPKGIKEFHSVIDSTLCFFIKHSLSRYREDKELNRCFISSLTSLIDTCDINLACLLFKNYMESACGSALTQNIELLNVFLSRIYASDLLTSRNAALLIASKIEGSKNMFEFITGSVFSDDPKLSLMCTECAIKENDVETMKKCMIMWGEGVCHVMLIKLGCCEFSKVCERLSDVVLSEFILLSITQSVPSSDFRRVLEQVLTERSESINAIIVNYIRNANMSKEDALTIFGMPFTIYGTEMLFCLSEKLSSLGIDIEFIADLVLSSKDTTNIDKVNVLCKTCSGYSCTKLLEIIDSEECLYYFMERMNGFKVTWEALKKLESLSTTKQSRYTLIKTLYTNNYMEFSLSLIVGILQNKKTLNLEYYFDILELSKDFSCAFFSRYSSKAFSFVERVSSFSAMTQTPFTTPRNMERYHQVLMALKSKLAEDDPASKELDSTLANMDKLTQECVCKFC